MAEPWEEILPTKAEQPSESPLVNEVADEADEAETVRIYTPRTRSEEELGDTQDLGEAPVRVSEWIESRKSAEQPSESADQITFDELESTEKEAESAALEKRLEDVRRRKIESFQLIQNEVAAEPETDRNAAPESELEDYNSYAETDAVRGELQYRCRNGRLHLLVAGVAEFLLICFTLLSRLSGAFTPDAITYLAFQLVLLITVMLASHRVIADGISRLIHLRAGADSVAAVAAFVCAIHTVLQFLNLTQIANGETYLYNAAAGFGLFWALYGRQCRLSRIMHTFSLVSHEGDKVAAVCVEDPLLAEQLGRYLPTVGEPKVVYPQKCRFLSKFMENSYDDEGHEPLFAAFAPAVVGLSLAAAAVYVLVGDETRNWWNAVGAFAALLCAGMPVFAVAAANLPLRRANRRLLRRGAMLIGWKAVETYRDTDALVVEAADVFPAECVQLHGIKTFSGARIDEAILDAAAVSIEAGGPLAGVFLRVIEKRTDMLQKVETLLYEQEMGLSGWVGNRRVLVGNRRLLENHGVDVPSRDYEMRYTKEGRQLVYLSTGGELCAMFVVSYRPNEQIAHSLSALTHAGISVLIRTCDPNVTAELVSQTFDIDEERVGVLNTAAGRHYEELTAEPQERQEALLAGNGRLEGLGAALGGCRRLYWQIRTLGILQMVLAGIGWLATAVMLFAGLPLNPLSTVLYLLVGTAATRLLSQFFGDV